MHVRTYSIHIGTKQDCGVERGESGRLSIRMSPKIVHTHAQEDGECKEQHDLLQLNYNP